VDHALMGVIVPAGEHELRLAFHSNWFNTGVALSLLFLLAALSAAIYLRRLDSEPSSAKELVPTST
jgi:uncharacterized membrane protein YfhO